MRWSVDCGGNFLRGVNRDVLSGRDGCREGRGEIESGRGYLSKHPLPAAGEHPAGRTTFRAGRSGGVGGEGDGKGGRQGKQKCGGVGRLWTERGWTAPGRSATQQTETNNCLPVCTSFEAADIVRLKKKTSLMDQNVFISTILAHLTSYKNIFYKITSIWM